jgi:hypothetical protein
MCRIFDALHHAVNEQAAIQAAFNALRTGGVCITSEPGQGHQESVESIGHIKKYNTTEKDMQPTKIIKLGYQAGFQQFKVFPHAFDLCHFVYTRPNKMYLPYGAENIQDSSAHDKDEIMGNLAWLMSISHLNGITLMLNRH